VTPEEIIREAILKRRRLSFTYGGGTRIVDPYILGVDDEGRLLLSAVQVSGGSGAGFRTFRVDAIAAPAVTDQKFFGNHPDYNPRDRLFAHVLCQIRPRK
jgi:predicted DNA-binding transcriptional regulator YafY